MQRAGNSCLTWSVSHLASKIQDKQRNRDRSRSWGVQRRLESRQNFQQLGKHRNAIKLCRRCLHGALSSGEGAGPAQGQEERRSTAVLGSASLAGNLPHSLLLPLCSFCSCWVVALHYSLPKFQFFPEFFCFL